jgi:hypothetical protein
MAEKIILYGLVSIIVTLALRYARKGSEKNIVPTKNGQFYLRMNKLYGIMGIIGFFFGLFITVMIIITNSGLPFAIITLLIFLGTGLPCFIYYKNHCLKFNDKLIEVKNFFGREKRISWIEIQNISFNHFSGLLTILDNKGNKIKIHQHIVGLSSFLKMMKEKTNWTADKLRIPITDKGIKR